MIDLKRAAFMGIVGGILGGAIFLVARLLKQPATRNDETGDILVRYPPILGWFAGASGGIVVAGLVILPLLHPFKSLNEFLAVAAVGTSFLLMSAALAVYLFKMRILVTEEGLEYHGLLGRPRSIRWPEVTRVKFASDGSFVVTSADKSSVKLQPMMQGRMESIALIEQRIPTEVVEASRKHFEKCRKYMQNSASTFGQKNSSRE